MLKTEIWRINASLGYFMRGRRFLHRVVWEENFGPVPPGMLVHHRDGDRENNVPENLELMDRADHMAHHMAEQAHLLPDRLTKASRARPFRDFVCTECGKPFKSQGHREADWPSYCSRLCKGRAYEKRSRR